MPRENLTLPPPAGFVASDEYARIVAEKDARIAELEERLRDLLAPFEDDPCLYDHHGYCQTHFIEPGDQCCVKLARAALKEDDNG